MRFNVHNTCCKAEIAMVKALAFQRPHTAPLAAMVTRKGSEQRCLCTANKAAASLSLVKGQCHFLECQNDSLLCLATEGMARQQAGGWAASRWLGG